MTPNVFSLFSLPPSEEDNGIVLEKEISKEEMAGVIELFRRNCAASETAPLQKVVAQMDKYEVRREAGIQATMPALLWCNIQGHSYGI